MGDKNEQTQEDRLLASIAHASVIASGIGIVVGLVIYFAEKDKSAWAAGQALQAVLYQVAGLVVIALAWVGWMLFYFAFIIVMVENDTGSKEPPAALWFIMATMCCPLFITAAWILYGFYGAIRTWMGNDFRYIIMGRFIDGVIKPAAI